MATCRILIVDDEEPVRKALRRTLSGDDVEVIDCGVPREALALLRRESVDVIISDLAMPDMNGLDFLKHARALRPDTVRIVLTGHADVSAAVQAINEGEVYRFVLKPWDSFDVRVMVRMAAHHLEQQRETARQAARGRDAERSGAHPADEDAPEGHPVRAGAATG